MILGAYGVYQIIILICMVFIAFFSATETALVSSNPIRIEAYARMASKNGKRVMWIMDNIEEAMSMVLIGHNIANIAATSFIAYIIQKSFVLSQNEMFAATFFADIIEAIVLLIFCEVSPKIIARARSEEFLFVFSSPITILMMVFKPGIKVSLVFSQWIKKKFRVRENDDSLLVTREEIDILFKIGEKEGIIDQSDLLFISEILSFKELSAIEIMTPVRELVSIDANRPMKELIDIIAASRFSKIPVYDESQDNLIGYVFYRDVLRDRKKNKIRDIMEPARYVPATKKIYELYFEMQKDGIPVVFVVSEYGAVLGIITHEDIAEEIVGEIYTRDHSKEDVMVSLNDTHYLIDPAMDVNYFQRFFKCALEKKGYKTISGFLITLLGRIPRTGEIIKYGKFSFVIESANERSIEEIMLVIPSPGKKKNQASMGPMSSLPPRT